MPIFIPSGSGNRCGGLFGAQRISIEETPSTTFCGDLSVGQITRRNLVKALAGAPLAPALGAQAPAPSDRAGWRVGSTAERLRTKPYRKRLCRVENYPSCLTPTDTPIGISVEEYVDLIDDAGVEVQIVAAELNRGTPRFPSKMLPPRPHVERDRIPRFLELAHRKGIVVLSYISMNYCKPLKPIHPEWMMKLLDDGRPATENLGWFCFNSPFRDWRAEHLIEYLDHLDLDGFYFDDMNWGSHEERPHYPGCYCRYCEEMFRRETGLAVPVKVDLTSIDFRRWVNWRYDKLRDFLSHITRKVKAKYPDAVIDFNYYGRHRSDWSLAHPLNPLGLDKVGAHFFIETNQIEDGSSFAAKTARANGAPFAIWRHAMQTLPESVGSSAPYPEPWSPILHGLAGLANGGASVYGMFDGPMPLRRDMMKTTFREIKKRADYMDGETVKYALLHYSQTLRDFRPEPADAASQYGLRTTKGAYEILNRSHLLVDIVFDEQLETERLSPYKVLVLSNSACLSEKQCEAVRQFVRRGGTLVATHQTSLFDELGRIRKNFELADLFGLDYRGPASGGGLHGVVFVPREESLRREFGYVISFAAEETEVAQRPGIQVEVLCTRSNLKGKRPLDNFDTKTAHDEGQPAVTVHSFGAGRAIYISGDIGAGYLHNPYPPLKRFVAALVRRARPPIEVEAPQAIEVSAATRGRGELIVHLLNNPTPWVPFTTPVQDSTTYLYLQEVNPIHNVRLRFIDAKIRRARLPLQDRELEIAANPASVVVPEIKLHEVVLLDLES